MTRALLVRGADPALVDRVGKNAMTYAAGEGRTEIVRLLLDKGSATCSTPCTENDLTALMWAAGYGHTDTARVLIEAGARVDLVDNRGKSALDMSRANASTRPRSTCWSRHKSARGPRRCEPVTSRQSFAIAACHTARASTVSRTSWTRSINAPRDTAASAAAMFAPLRSAVRA